VDIAKKYCGSNPVSATAIDKRMLVYCCVHRKGFMRVNRSEATAISRDELTQNPQSSQAPIRSRNPVSATATSLPWKTCFRIHKKKENWKNNRCSFEKSGMIILLENMFSYRRNAQGIITLFYFLGTLLQKLSNYVILIYCHILIFD